VLVYRVRRRVSGSASTVGDDAQGSIFGACELVPAGMKGGSATKILLETTCTCAVYAAFESDVNSRDEKPDVLAHRLRSCFAQYEATVRRTYDQTSSISRLIDSAAGSITRSVPFPITSPAPGSLFVAPTGRGRVLYVGVGTSALLGVIDASECYPTYGSRFNDVHGFVVGGWETMESRSDPKHLRLCVPSHLRADAALPSAAEPQIVSLDLLCFRRDYVPTLCAADTVILLAALESGAHAGAQQLGVAVEALDAAKRAGASVRHVLIVSDESEPVAEDGTAMSSRELLEAVLPVAPDGVVVRLPSLWLRREGAYRAPATAAAASSVASPPPPSHLAELAAKLVLNAVTTGAHIKKGVIFSNRMINVGITNQKLFHRALSIVQSVSQCSSAVARTSLLRSIYHRDFTAGEVGPSLAEIDELPASSHVRSAALQMDLVPVAILLAAAGARSPPTLVTERQAVEALQTEPVLRRSLAAFVGGTRG
jgi:hypothetical protein